MCHAQGHNIVMPVRVETVAPQSRVKHSTTQPMCSHLKVVMLHIKSKGNEAHNNMLVNILPLHIHLTPGLGSKYQNNVSEGKLHIKLMRVQLRAKF